MKKYSFFLGAIGIGFYGFAYDIGHAQALSTLKGTPYEAWNVHRSATDQQHTTTSLPRYHKKPRLYPSKHKMNNPLRQKGWHTHPDPYIEEGGVYTNSPHPALTDDQATMREYTSGSPNSYVTPPATVLGSKRSRHYQQQVRIKDPLPGKVPPIELPPS